MPEGHVIHDDMTLIAEVCRQPQLYSCHHFVAMVVVGKLLKLHSHHGSTVAGCSSQVHCGRDTSGGDAGWVWALLTGGIAAKHG